MEWSEGGKWDNCNSMINKYIFFKKTKEMRLIQFPLSFFKRFKKKEIGNLFENIMKENFPNLAKEIDFQEVQEAEKYKAEDEKQ